MHDRKVKKLEKSTAKYPIYFYRNLKQSAK